MGTAYDMGRRSMAMAEAKDRQGWLSLFDDRAVVEDPVGPSVFDPEAKGHKGADGIAAFYDDVISTSESVRFEIHQTAECGSECAFAGTIHITLPGGMQGSVELVNIYRVTPEGRIASLRSFWEFDKLTFSET
ncbi:MAG TPA: nuclear transport factor 2 family protein [Acidimicrobiales bacterium]|nr:nuclear transport factor 2 family protein [Acidimicrobiales bacterium]